MAAANCIPTDEQILEASKRIQRTWSPGEERSRRTGSARRIRFRLPATKCPRDKYGRVMEWTQEDALSLRAQVAPRYDAL